MTSCTPDIERDEERFAEEVGATFTELRARHAACPDLALVLAAEAGMLPEDTSAVVSDHVARCSWCQALRADLADPELLQLEADAARRIRRRVSASVEGSTRPSRWLDWKRPWVLFPAGAALVVVIAAATALLVNVPTPSREPGPSVASAPAGVAPQVDHVPAAPPTVFRLEKPPVKLPLGGVIVRRSEGRSDAEQLVADLRSALVPYRSDDFAHAARLLEQVARRHPTAPEPWLYLGVCRLFLADEERAAMALEDALRLAKGELADDAAWYLSLAYQRLGRPEEAVKHLRQLCEGRGGYAERACAAVGELRRSPAAAPKK